MCLCHSIRYPLTVVTPAQKTAALLVPGRLFVFDISNSNYCDIVDLHGLPGMSRFRCYSDRIIVFKAS